MTPTNRPRLLMCRPTHYGIRYVINPWMDGNVGRVDVARARDQWDALHGTLSELADIELIEPVEGLPDMPFSANFGLVCRDRFFVSRFRFDQRAGETPHAARWFADHGVEVAQIADPGSFEGEGDALFQPGEALLWGGYGVRTSLQVYRELRESLAVEIALLRLVDERFYHLDTCFCPLPNGRVLFYPPAFDQESVDAIRHRFSAENRIELSDVDALQFACNAVVLGDSIVTNAASAALRARLGEWGYAVRACPLSEFLLAGGGAKCLVLRLDNDPPKQEHTHDSSEFIPERMVRLQGQLLDSGLMNVVLDGITEGGGSFEIQEFTAGIRHDQESTSTMRVVAPNTARLDTILHRLIQLGAQVTDADVDARLEAVTKDGVAPQDFYSTTIYPTDLRVNGEWLRAAKQRMDAVIVVRDAQAVCTLIRDLRTGDRVVCGVDGIRIHAKSTATRSHGFEFMSSGVSSERRVELAVDSVAWEMRRVKEQGGKIVVVAGPVVIHTGGGPYLAQLIRLGYVQALLGGNAIAVHDLESNRFGTSLGVDLERGVGVEGGHRHHLQIINQVRACGGIAQAVEQGVVSAGIFYECVRRGVPFALAGSIRDDGPLPETEMDLIEAQREYARLIEGADLILMLASMLHAIGVGNMTPAGVRLICVDISPAVVTKLADRGSIESTGIVTDVGLFLNLLARELAEV